MITPLKTYSLKGNTAILGGYDLGGYGEDGGLEYEMASDLGEMTVGALGDTTFSAYENDLVMLTITVKETTKSYRDLGLLLAAQLELMRAGASLTPLNFLHIDGNNGDRVESQYAAFLTRPGPSKAKKVSERQFKIGLPGAARYMNLGAFNLI